MKLNSLRNFIALTALLLFFVSASGLQAQEKKDITYSILESGSVLDVQPYINALDNSDMRYHRLSGRRYVIVFMTGLRVELFSAQEIAKKGHPINVSEYPEEFPATRQEPVFALGANNFIIQYHTPTAKQHGTK